MTNKNLDDAIQKINLRLASYIDEEFYLPLKEELTGVTHSLGFNVGRSPRPLGRGSI